MSNHWRTKLRLSPALVAALVACLFVFQSLGLLASAAASASQGVGLHGARPEGAAHCRDAQNSGDPARHHDHSECCVFCSGAGRDASPDALAIVAAVIQFFAPQADGVVLVSTANDVVPRLIGWASSWSSRAPPARA